MRVVSSVSDAVCTKQPALCALGGCGLPELVWAYESPTDMMARALKIDPLEFRRRNITREGGTHATGTPLKDAPVEKVLEHVAARMNSSKPLHRRDGVIRPRPGLPISLHAAISPPPSLP